MSEYRGWSTRANGIKVKSGGAFGVINLMAPRDIDPIWHEDYTSVVLRFKFTSSKTQQPIVLERTFMTFYDFDSTIGYRCSRLEP